MKNSTGLSIVVMVVGTVGLTFIAMMAGVAFVLRDPKPPPTLVTTSEVWLDNRTPDRLTIELDRTPMGTLDPIGSDGAVFLLQAADGQHELRALTPSGEERWKRTLDLHAVRLVYPLGAPMEYAVSVVHYAKPGTKSPPDSAKLLAPGPDEGSFKMPVSVPVVKAMNEPFPDKHPGPAVRQLCRVESTRVGCDGGPKTLTSMDRYSGQGRDE